MGAQLLISDFAGQVTPEVARSMILATADDHPLTAMMLNAAEKMAVTGADKFSWYKDSLSGRRTQIDNGGTAYTSGSTSLVVDDGGVFKANDVVVCEATGEVILVTAVSSNTLTVVRGLGTVVAANANSVANNVWLLNCGNASGEGGATPTAVMTGQTEVVNSVQTFKEAIKLTGLATRVSQMTDEQRAHQRRKKFEKFVRDIEHSLLHGTYETGETDAAGLRVRTSGGLIKAITTNAYAPGGTATLTQLEDGFFGPLFNYAGGEKWVIAGGTVVSTIHQMYRGKVVIENGATDAGLQISTIITAYGRAKIVHHKGMIGGFATAAIGFDVNQLRLRHTNGGVPHLKTDLQNKTDDAVIDEWFAELGLEWGDEKYHALMTGLTGMT